MRELEDSAEFVGLPGSDSILGYHKVVYYYSDGDPEVDPELWTTKEAFFIDTNNERLLMRKMSMYPYVDEITNRELAAMYNGGELVIGSIYIPKYCNKIEIYDDQDKLLAGGLLTPMGQEAGADLFQSTAIEYSRDKTLAIYSKTSGSTSDIENILSYHNNKNIKPHYEEGLELGYTLWEDSVVGFKHFRNTLLRSVITNSSNFHIEIDGTMMYTGDNLKYSDTFSIPFSGIIFESCIIKSDGSILSLGDFIQDDERFQTNDLLVFDNTTEAYFDSVNGVATVFKY